MANTIHIPVTKEEKELIKNAAKIEKLKHTTFLRRVALLESDRILKENSEGSE